MQSLGVRFSRFSGFWAIVFGHQASVEMQEMALMVKARLVSTFCSSMDVFKLILGTLLWHAVG